MKKIVVFFSIVILALASLVGCNTPSLYGNCYKVSVELNGKTKKVPIFVGSEETKNLSNEIGDYQITRAAQSILDKCLDEAPVGKISPATGFITTQTVYSQNPFYVDSFEIEHIDFYFADTLVLNDNIKLYAYDPSITGHAKNIYNGEEYIFFTDNTLPLEPKMSSFEKVLRIDNEPHFFVSTSSKDDLRKINYLGTIWEKSMFEDLYGKNPSNKTVYEFNYQGWDMVFWY